MEKSLAQMSGKFATDEAVSDVRRVEPASYIRQVYRLHKLLIVTLIRPFSGQKEARSCPSTRTMLYSE